MVVTISDTADKIAKYLHHEISLAELVDWSEQAVMEADFPESDTKVLSKTLARLGVADVRAFGLTWEACEKLLHDLGFKARIEITAS